MTAVLAPIRRRAAAVLLALSLVVLAEAADGCSGEKPTGVHVDGSRTPWGDPAKGQFAEFRGGTR